MAVKEYVDTGGSFDVVENNDGDVKVWKFTEADGVSEEDTLTLEANEDEYKATGTAPDEDCYLLVKRDKLINMIRVGEPGPLLIAYTGETGESHTYVQHDMDGTDVADGDMTELVEGFYYAPSESDTTTYYTLDDKVSAILKFPYGDESISGTVRIQSLEQQYISLPVKDKTIAEYFVDAVCDTLDADEDEVFQLLKSLPSTEDASGTFKVYKPGTTNRSSSNNFKTSSEDSDGIIEYRSFLCITKDFGQDYVDFSWNSKD